MYPETTNYQDVFDTIQSYTGLRVHNGRRDEAIRTIDEVLANIHPLGMHDLLVALRTSVFNESLWQKFIQAITVGETYFYRDQGQFDALRMHILPQLIAEREKTGNRQLRLWSAGCASGEEPYSLAMLLHEVLPDIDAWNITILGTDINLAFLERARRGLYRASSFRNETPEYLQKRWFKATPKGYQLDQTIRDMVVFQPLNLASSQYPSADNFTLNMDVIVCRNVTIYFDPTTVIEIIGRLHQSLNELGNLIVGHSELSTTLYQNFQTQRYQQAIFYQKAAPAKVKPRVAPVTSSRVKSQPALRRVLASLPPAAPKLKAPVAPADTPDNSLEIAWSQAKEAADCERWEEALEYLGQVETKHLFRPEFHYLRGLVHMAASNVDDALWAWRQALYCDPMFALAHYSLGDLYAHGGETTLAENHWHQAQAAIARLDPQNHLLFAEEITVEMLQGLLAYRFSILAGGNGGKQQ